MVHCCASFHTAAEAATMCLFSPLSHPRNGGIWVSWGTFNSIECIRMNPAAGWLGIPSASYTSRQTQCVWRHQGVRKKHLIASGACGISQESRRTPKCWRNHRWMAAEDKPKTCLPGRIFPCRPQREEEENSRRIKQSCFFFFCFEFGKKQLRVS